MQLYCDTILLPFLNGSLKLVNYSKQRGLTRILLPLLNGSLKMACGLYLKHQRKQFSLVRLEKQSEGGMKTEKNREKQGETEK